MDWKTERKLKKGEISIDAILDLHGFYVLEASQILSKFLHQQHAQGAKWVLVIHGKGKDGKGELKRQCGNWLLDHPTVNFIHPAAPKDGGEGAVYVKLKRLNRAS